MKRSLSIAFILATIGLLVSCRNSSPEARANWVVKHLIRELHLNEDQQAKLQDVKSAFLDARKRHESDRQKQREEVNLLILSDNIDPARALALLEAHQAAVKQEAPAILAKISVFHAALNAEQKKKLVDKMEKLRQRFQE